jgi:hypothetical protein
VRWFEWSQNNSGGSFVVDKKLCHRLFIEAEDEHAAEQKAFELGVYYDGCADGIDCNCCGDRWYSPDELTFPLKYSDDITFITVEEYAQHLADKYGWTTPDARLFYANGTVKDIFTKKKN